jgi:hypothetical protein
MQTSYQDEKKFTLNYFEEMERASADEVANVLRQSCGQDYTFYGVYPFNQLKSVVEVAEKVWQPLKHSLTNMQRRQDVFIAGTSEINGENWTMSMGHFMGLFDKDWLGIRATRKLAMLRYAEFNCIENGKITQSGLWLDIIGFMQQVGVNPLPPQTGASFVYPGPRDHSGIQLGDNAPEEAVKTLKVLNQMIDDLSALNISGDDRCSPDVLARTWHEDMAWYGPAGIGATYMIERYQEQHQ